MPKLPNNKEIGSLKGTLTPEKTLPTPTTDPLSIFSKILKRVTNESAKRSQISGLEGLEKVGVDPTKVSGGTLAGIIDFAKKGSVRGISDIYTSTLDLIKAQQTSAQKQLNTILTTGAIASFDDDQITALATMVGMDPSFLLGIKKAEEKNQEGEEKVVDKFTDSKGNRVLVMYNPATQKTAHQAKFQLQ